MSITSLLKGCQVYFAMVHSVMQRVAGVSTYRPRLAQSEDGSALQARNHRHDRVQVVHVAQFLQRVRHMRAERNRPAPQALIKGRINRGMGAISVRL